MTLSKNFLSRLFRLFSLFYSARCFFWSIRTSYLYCSSLEWWFHSLESIYSNCSFLFWRSCLFNFLSYSFLSIFWKITVNYLNFDLTTPGDARYRYPICCNRHNFWLKGLRKKLNVGLTTEFETLHPPIIICEGSDPFCRSIRLLFAHFSRL